MPTVAASLLCKHAGSLRLPSGKTNLLRMMKARFIEPIQQRVAGGQLGIAYRVEDLWPELRAGVERILNDAAAPICTADFGVYVSAPARSRDKADRSVARMEKVKAEIDAGATITTAVEKVAGLCQGDPSPKTLAREWAKVKSLPWNQWHGVLVPGYKGRKAAPIHPQAWKLWVSLFGRDCEPSGQQSYEDLVKAAEAHGWGVMPSLRTFMRRWMSDVDARSRTALRKGPKRADRRHTPKGDLDHTEMPAMHGISIDGRRADTLGFDVADEHGRPFRPMLAGAVDIATRYCVGCEVIGDTENTSLYRRLLTGVFDTFGLPDFVQPDNTMAAANKDLTGGVALRYRHTRKNDDVDGVLKRCGVDVRFSKPGEPQGKIVEYLWRDIKDRLEKDPELQGSYLGKDTTSKPESYGSKPVPLDVFKRVLARAVKEYNERTGRRSKAGPSYKAAFEAKIAARPMRRLTAQQRRMFLAEAHVVTPSPAGEVRIGKTPHVNVYFHEALREFARPQDGKGAKGQKVVILVDPDDYTADAMAFTLDNRLIAENVGLWVKTGATNKADVEKLARTTAAVRKADRKRTAAVARHSEAEMRALRHVDDAPQNHPSATVTQLVPGRHAKVANGSIHQPAASAVPAGDPAKIKAALAAMRGDDFKPSSGPDLEMIERGEAFLARHRAG